MANLFLCKLRKVEKGGRKFLYGEINPKAALVVTGDAAYIADVMKEEPKQKEPDPKPEPKPDPKPEPKPEPEPERVPDDQVEVWTKPGEKVPETPDERLVF